ncbi:SapC family protein [Alteromonas sp. AMM-1]|uniref:SapC family protein n=1 Tax=Alteromonas sp. AMM-1 TaxID=3394233 RepID=UPI0039A6CD93
MATLQLLNNITHKDLRVQSHYSATFGDNISSVLVFPTEFDALHKEYPVLFRRHAEQGIQAIALLGLCAGENLYLNEHYPQPPVAGSWMARYVPGLLAKGPFMIGYQQQSGASEAVLHVDMDHPRITHPISDTEKDTGKPVFLPKGGESDYLQHIVAILNRLHLGQQEAKAFYAELDRLNLLTPVNLAITLSNGDKLEIQGHETICKDTFAALPADTLAMLHQKGWLAYVYAIQSSLHNLSWLIDMKNALEHSRS